MTRLTIPEGAHIRYRKNGRTLWGQKQGGKPITWTTKAPPAGTKVYVIGWVNSQQNLTATKVITHE